MWNEAALHLLDIQEVRFDGTGLERVLGRGLPAAVAEWFHVGADRRLAQLSDNNITSVASLGDPDHARFLDAGLLLLETDSQRCCRWVAPLDAGDDPGVYLVDPEDFTGDSRTVYAVSFTAYTEAAVWDALPFRIEDAVWSFDHELRPDAIRILDAWLDRRPTTYGWAHNQSCDAIHRFDGPTRVAVAVTGSMAVWTVTASPSADRTNQIADILGVPADDRPVRSAERTAIGSLAGQLDLSTDWDSPQTNGEIAADFGVAR